MAITNGVLALNDLLAVQNVSTASFGLDRVAATLAEETAYLNSRLSEMLSDFAFTQTEQSATWGGGGIHSMTKVDEYGLPLTQKSMASITAQFPLNLFRQAIGWTSEYVENATPSELATQFLQMRKGYLAAIYTDMARAIYGVGGNYTFVDKLTKNISLAVKTLINADGSVLPNSPAGASFDGSTHDHLHGEASLTYAFVDALIAEVVEHGNTKGLRLYISSTDKAAFSALQKSVANDRFVPLSSAQIIYSGVNSTVEKLNNLDVENQLIGYWLPTGCEVWVKPWCPASYILCVATQMPEKVLCYRQPALNPGWRIAATYSDYPLIGEFAQAKFGFGVFNRVMAAVLYTGNATYSAPTIV